MTARKALFQLHWLFGITVGIVLAIVGATGAVLSFEQQIVASFARADREVEANGRTPLPVPELLARIAADQPQQRIAGLNVVREPSQTVRVTFAPEGARPAAAVEGGRPRGEQRYVDPYTGVLLASSASIAETFFRSTRQLHRWLMLGDLGDRDIGRQIVGASTLLLIFMALTGLYLRWPRGPAARRLKTWLVPDFRLKGRAFLWSLHSVVGTWVLPIYLVIALTGLQWSYEWYRDGLYNIAGVERPAGPEGPREPRAGGQAGDRSGGPDLAGFTRAWDAFVEQTGGKFTSVNVNLAARPGRSMEFRYLGERPSHERAFNTLAVDAEGKAASEERYRDKKWCADRLEHLPAALRQLLRPRGRDSLPAGEPRHAGVRGNGLDHVPAKTRASAAARLTRCSYRRSRLALTRRPRPDRESGAILRCGQGGTATERALLPPAHRPHANPIADRRGTPAPVPPYRPTPARESAPPAAAP